MTRRIVTPPGQLRRVTAPLEAFGVGKDHVSVTLGYGECLVTLETITASLNGVLLGRNNWVDVLTRHGKKAVHLQSLVLSSWPE